MMRIGMLSDLLGLGYLKVLSVTMEKPPLAPVGGLDVEAAESQMGSVPSPSWVETTATLPPGPSLAGSEDEV